MTHRANDVAYSTCMFLRISSARDPQHETVMMMMTVIDDGDDGDDGEDGDDSDDSDDGDDSEDGDDGQGGMGHGRGMEGGHDRGA